MSAATIQKVTVSVPVDLLGFADAKATERGITRSRLIAELLAEFKRRQEDALAAEGYQFYAQEAQEFAARRRDIAAYWAFGRCPDG